MYTRTGGTITNPEGRMKTVFFARHAKSNWGEAGVSDFDRPINSQGEVDAPVMAKRLHKKHFIPEIIISSDAHRALQTANEYKKVLVPEQNVLKKSSLYNAMPADIAQVLNQQKASLSSIMIVGHNPGMSEIVSIYAKNSGPVDMPACGVAVVQFDVESWGDIKPATGKLLALEYPEK